MSHIKTNRAIVFGVFRPGERNLVQVLDEWDDSSKTGSNMQAFIETEFKSFRVDIQELKNAVYRTIYVCYYPEGRVRSYALTSNSEHDVAIQLNDHHPLTQFIRKYQEKVRIGGIYSDFTSREVLDSFDWHRLRSTGRELFYSALRDYQATRQKQFKEKRDAFLNFFRDPLCLSGAMVGTLLDVYKPVSSRSQSDSYKPIPLDDINLPLLPSIRSAYEQALNTNSGAGEDTPRLLNSGIGDHASALPAVAETNGEANKPALPAVLDSDEGKMINSLMRLREEIEMNPERSKDNFLATVSKRVLTAQGITPDKMEAETFLLVCLSDDRLMKYYDILAPILIDKASEAMQGKIADKAPQPEKIETWQNTFYNLLESEFHTVGNLLAGVEGLYNLSQAFEGIDRDERPEIIIPNCSLSKIYERNDIREKFETLLHNTNFAETNLSNYIGFCVVPRVAYIEKEVSNKEESMYHDTTSTSQVTDLGDATSFSDLSDFVEYCDSKKLRIMTFVSLADDLPGYRLNARTLEDAFLTDFLRQLENSAGRRALEHISLCIPDKIFMTELRLDSGSKFRTPLVVTKGAYLVAAIAMRNDSVSKLRQLLGPKKKYIQNDEPGLIIGPQTIWRNSEMYKALPELFELSVPSDLNMDAGFMEKLLNPDDRKNSSFSLLCHEKGKNIFLRLFNTAYRSDNQCSSVSMVRMCDYLSNVIRKAENINKISRELNNPKPKGKVMFDAETPYINTWKPENVNYDIDYQENGVQEIINKKID